jgi:hypothetical protein
MKARSTTRFLLTALVLGVTALVTEPDSAAGGDGSRAWNRVPTAPAVTFRSTPGWEMIPGTGVAWVREHERPDYDLFRYGSRYYIYNDGYWYRAARLNRPFVVIDERNVPIAIADVPHDQWRSYPPGWMNPKNPHYSGKHDNRKRTGQNRSSNR